MNLATVVPCAFNTKRGIFAEPQKFWTCIFAVVFLLNADITVNYRSVGAVIGWKTFTNACVPLVTNRCPNVKLPPFYGRPSSAVYSFGRARTHACYRPNPFQLFRRNFSGPSTSKALIYSVAATGFGRFRRKEIECTFSRRILANNQLPLNITPDRPCYS